MTYEQIKKQCILPHLQAQEELVGAFKVSQWSTKNYILHSAFYAAIILALSYFLASSWMMIVAVFLLSWGISFLGFNFSRNYLLAVTNTRLQTYNVSPLGRVTLCHNFEYDQMESMEVQEGYWLFTINIKSKDGEKNSFSCQRNLSAHVKGYLLSRAS